MDRDEIYLLKEIQKLTKCTQEQPYLNNAIERIKRLLSEYDQPKRRTSEAQSEL